MNKNSSPSKKSKKKEYVVIYKSLEHFEVLGFVNADSLREAKKIAQQELLEDAKHYKVKDGEIAELKDLDKIFFDISF